MLCKIGKPEHARPIQLYNFLFDLIFFFFSSACFPTCVILNCNHEQQTNLAVNTALVARINLFFCLLLFHFLVSVFFGRVENYLPSFRGHQSLLNLEMYQSLPFDSSLARSMVQPSMFGCITPFKFGSTKSKHRRPNHG